MGGRAFSHGPNPLLTPRMPKATYNVVKANCINRLYQLFDLVDSPSDGPEKEDFGDVDVFVANPKGVRGNKQQLMSRIESLLGAVQVIVDNGAENSAHMAIPWPTQLSADGSLGTAAPKHIQVDVTIFDKVDDLTWMLFKHAHGDFWNLLGSAIDIYGLTVDDKALWVRIPEIEGKNKKASKIFLTSIPNKVLEFLNIPIDKFWGGSFRTTREMFECIGLCPMFCPRSPEWKRYDGVEPLKSSLRKRIETRPIVRQWFQEYIPECRNDERCNLSTNRDSIRTEVFQSFNIEAEFEKRRKDFLAGEQMINVKRVIKTHLPNVKIGKPTETLTRLAVREAFRRIIVNGDKSYPVLPTADLKLENGWVNVEAAESFIKTHKNSEALAEAAFALQEEELSATISR